MERHSFCIVLGDSPKTKWKLCLSTKFSHQNIRLNYGMLRMLDLFTYLYILRGLVIVFEKSCRGYVKNFESFSQIFCTGLSKNFQDLEILWISGVVFKT